MHSSVFHTLVTLFLLLFCAIPSSAKSISVEAVEPPNWWVGMKLNRVRLLIRGSGLRDFTARFDNEELVVSEVDDLGNSNYAVVEFSVPERLAPGIYNLIITRGQDSATIKYPIIRRDPNEGKHQGFSNQDVVYLITPDRFANGDPNNDEVPHVLDDFNPNDPSKRHGGDLRGIIDHLDYLEELGVTSLWLNPVLVNNGKLSYHGYAATDLYRIDPRLGDNALYSEFVKCAHDHNLKVIFDHVNNHVGINHPWVNNPPSEDWFNGSPKEHLHDRHYLMSICDPHADEESVRMLKTFWFVKGMPDLNYRNRLLSDYRVLNTIWWIETAGFDGIREDTYPYVDQQHLTRWTKAIKDEYPDFSIVGEVWSTAPAYVARFQAGMRMPDSVETNLPAVMDFPFMQACRNFVKGDGTLRDIYQLLAQDFLYSDPDNLMVFVDNHDTPRIAHLGLGDTRRTRIVLTLLVTTRGIPQLLYGTELGMEGGEKHVEVRSDFPGGFPGHVRSAFSKESRTIHENEVYDFVRTLLHIRKEYSALNQGHLIHYPVPLDVDVYKFLRIHNEQKVLILINGESEALEVDLHDVQIVRPGTVLEDLLQDSLIELDRSMKVQVPALTAQVFLIVSP